METENEVAEVVSDLLGKPKQTETQSKYADINWGDFENLADYQARGPVNEATGKVMRFRRTKEEKLAGLTPEQAFDARRAKVQS